MSNKLDLLVPGFVKRRNGKSTREATSHFSHIHPASYVLCPPSHPPHAYAYASYVITAYLYRLSSYLLSSLALKTQLHSKLTTTPSASFTDVDCCGRQADWKTTNNKAGRQVTDEIKGHVKRSWMKCQILVWVTTRCSLVYQVSWARFWTRVAAVSVKTPL